MNHEITQKTILLDEQGHLAVKGYAKRMQFIYNRDRVNNTGRKLKEWNFYQFIKDHYSLQMTIGHVSYMCSVSVSLIDLDTGKRFDFGTMKPLVIPRLDRDPEKRSFVAYKDKHLYMSFQVKEDKRILCVRGSNRQFKNVDIRLVVDNDPANEKMVIATPFDKPSQFYLNYKENYYHATGSVRFDAFQMDFGGATGLLDWGRGVWPYEHEWFWGNLSSHIEGVPFGFNIGWGFGDLSHATENMYFYNKKAYKLGQLQVNRDEEDMMKPWELHDEEGKIQLKFTPYFDNYTENKYVVIDTHCHQVYGFFEGVIQTEDGPKTFKDEMAFIEHAVNKW